MNRRPIIATAAGSALALGAGCNSPTEANEVDITVKNGSQQQVTIDVFFLNEDRETMFSTRYTLAPDEADESEEFSGEPEYVYVVLNESTVVVEDFTGEPCSGTRTVPTGIAYDATDELHIGFAC